MRGPAALVLAGVLGGCAGGTDARQPDGTDTEGDELGSSELTNDTIDPTAFTTTVATTVGSSSDEDGSSGPTASSEGSDSTSTATGDGPTVVEVSPADGEAGVDPAATLVLRFSAAMDPSTIVGDDGSCTGAVQLSRDDFASCAALDPEAIASAGDTVFELVPADVLDSTALYRVRVTTDAAGADASPLAAVFESEGFRVRYFHTIAIDGEDDWNGDEAFATSTAGHTAYTAWDADYVYLGMRSPDVAAGNGQVWVVAYFGGPAGTSDGVLYNTQQPTMMPFDAQWHLRWRADNIYTDARTFDGIDWDTQAWAIGDGDVYQQGELLELRVARSDIGDPDLLELHMGILRETPFDEASWAAHPEGSYVDGLDPQYTQYWAFDLLGSDAPAQHVPSP